MNLKRFCRRFLREYVHGNQSERQMFLAGLCLRLFPKSGAVQKAVIRGDQWAQWKRSEAALLDHTAGHTGCPVYIFAGCSCYATGGGQRSAQLARAFFRMGHPVYFYYYSYVRPAESGPLCVKEHEQIFEPRCKAFFQADLRDAICVFEAPIKAFLPYLRHAGRQGCRTVYEHIDNWETELGEKFYSRRIFQKFVRRVDFLVGTSQKLVEQLRAAAPDAHIACLPNAVDLELFDASGTYAVPQDMPMGAKRVAIYVGTMMEKWFDWQRMERQFADCPDVHFVLIGMVDEEKRRKYGAWENVTFLGPKDKGAVPAYLAHANVGIIPFRCAEITDYVSPIKIFEYIAMGLVVLSTPMPDILQYPNTICAEEAEVWTQALRQARPWVDARAFAQENSWQRRAGQILELARPAGRTDGGLRPARAGSERKEE